MNENCQIEVSILYDDITINYDERLFLKKDNKWGILASFSDESKTLFEFDEIDDFYYPDPIELYENFAVCRAKKGGKWGYIYENGEYDINGKYQHTVLINFEFDEIGYFNKSQVKVKKYQLWGFIDKYGKTLTPFQYDEIRKKKLYKGGFFCKKTWQMGFDK